LNVKRCAGILAGTLLASYIFLLSTMSSHINEYSNFKFYIFATHPCSECHTYLLWEEYVQKLRSYGEVNVYYIEEGSNALYYFKIVDTINSLSSKKYPYITPLIGIFKNNNLVAIILGIAPESILQSILANNHLDLGVYLYFQYESEVVKIVLDQRIMNFLAKLFERSEKWQMEEMSFPSALASLALVAINDSLNLVNIYFLFLLLFIVFFEMEREDTLKIGFSFSLGIFTGRCLLEIGLFSVFKYSWQLRYGIIPISFIIGILGVLNFLGKVKFSFNIFHKIKISNLRVIFNYFFGFFIYLLASSNISHEYFMVSAVEVNWVSEKMMLLSLLVYNIMVLLPLLITTLLTYLIAYITSLNETLKIKYLKFKKWPPSLLGIIIILLCFLIL